GPDGSVHHDHRERPDPADTRRDGVRGRHRDDGLVCAAPPDRSTRGHTGRCPMSMSQHPVQPRSSAGTMPLTPFVLLGALWAAVALTWLAWFAGRLTAWLTDHPAGPRFGSQFVIDVVHGRWDVVYPHLNHLLVAVVYGVLVVAAGGPVVGGWIVWELRRTHAGDPLPSLARPSEVADLTPAGITHRARQP